MSLNALRDRTYPADPGYIFKVIRCRILSAALRHVVRDQPLLAPCQRPGIS